MKKINRKYLFGDEYSEKLLKTAEDINFFSNRMLSIKTFDNAVMLPAKFFSWTSIPWAKGGILDESGSYIEESASFAMFSHNYTNKKMLTRLYGAYSYELEEVENYNEDMVLYAGFYIKQWGHFLLECLSRLWPVVQNPERYKNMKIVFLPMRDCDEVDATFLECLNLIGIRKEQIVLLRKPTKFKKVIIPETSIYAGYVYTKEYKDLLNHIISRAMEKTTKIKTFKKIYLSRKNWAFTQNRDIGEEKIEKFFNKNGFKSITLEKHSLVEQIHIMQEAEHVASAVCTLPHNLIFAHDCIKATFINKTNRYNILQFTVDSMKNLDVTYVDAYFLLFLCQNSGVGPFLFDVNDNLINYAKDNGMKLPEQESMKKYIMKYLDLYFEKIEDFTDEELFEFRNLYKIMRNRFRLYSTKELMFKKYFHKIMWKLSFGEQKIRYFEKYIKYKNKLNKVNTAVSNGMESSKHMLRAKDESLAL